MTEFESKFEKAEQFFNEKKYLHAIQIYQSLLDLPHLKRKAVIKLIEIFGIQNQFDSAVNVFKRYLSEEENDEDMLTFYAQFLIKNERYLEAHDVLSSISNDKRPERNFLMGIVNYYLEDYQIAVINFAEFIKRNKKSELLPQAHLFLSKCYLKKNEISLALEHAKESEKIYNQDYEVYSTLAIIFYEKEMYYHALDNIQKSIKLNTGDINSLLWSGRILLKMGEPEQAKKILEYSVDISNENIETLNMLGMISLEASDYNSAEEYFNKVVKLDPENQEAKDGITICKSLQNKEM